MAEYTSSEFSTTNPWVKYKIIVKTGSYNTEKNTTPVTITVRAYRTNTGYETYGDGICYVKLDGSEYSQNIPWTNKINENGTNLFSKEFTVSHNSDGTKSISVQAKFELYSVVSSSPSYQGQSFTLPAIPRASTMEFDGEFTIGDTVFFSITSAASSFTHKLFCVVEGKETRIADGVSSEFEWDTGKWNNGFLWKESENAGEYLYGSIRLYTFSGKTNVGSRDYPFTALIPNEYEGEPVKPMVQSGITPYNDTLDETWHSLADNYIATISKIKVDFSGSYVNPGIGFGSYSVQIDGVDKGEQTDPDYVEYITDTAFLTSGSHVVKAIVRDKSGMESSVETNITVDPYLPPFVSPIAGYPVAQRVERTEEGKYIPSHRGKLVLIRARRNFTELEGNNEAELRYSVNGGAPVLALSADGIPMDFGSADNDANFVIPSELWEFEIDKAYTITLTPTDRIGKGNDYVITVPVAIPTAHAAEGGNGFALGMLATNDRTFRSQYQPIFYRPIKHVIGDTETQDQPFLISEMEKDGWLVRNWSDGTAECFGELAANGVKVNVPWGTMFESQAIRFDYPVEFESAPFELLSVSSPTLWAMVSYGTENTTAKTKEITFARPSVSEPENGHTVTLRYYVRGKIKKENE